MLFTTEALVREVNVNKPFERDVVIRIMERKEQELLTLYQQKHQAILEKSRQFDELVFNAGRWWLDTPDPHYTLRQVRAFIDNIDCNFGVQSPAWQKIRSAAHRAERKQQILQALMHYRIGRDAWDRLFD